MADGRDEGAAPPDASQLIAAAERHLARTCAASCLVHKPGAPFIVAAGTPEQVLAMVRDELAFREKGR